MRVLHTIILGLMLTAGLAFAGSNAAPPTSTEAARGPASEPNPQWMLEGEKRYRVNCGRCHQAPHKFQPRVMATAVRHMRVRAMLTEDDMHYVLYYLTH
jgi:cytochrome c5